MGEKHWLVRDDNKDKEYVVFAGGKPSLYHGRWRCESADVRLVTSQTSFSGREIFMVGTGDTVYGHKLEPGGGPVDVSEWFPEGGRRCHNCGSGSPDGMDCDNGVGGAGCAGYGRWKPREQECLSYVYAYEIIDAPALGQGEEGGRTMADQKQKFPVQVWTQDEDGKRAGLLDKAPDFMEATGPQNARDKVVLAIAKLGAGVDDHEIVICKPLPLATA